MSIEQQDFWTTSSTQKSRQQKPNRLSSFTTGAYAGVFSGLILGGLVTGINLHESRVDSGLNTANSLLACANDLNHQYVSKVPLDCNQTIQQRFNFSIAPKLEDGSGSNIEYQASIDPAVLQSLGSNINNRLQIERDEIIAEDWLAPTAGLMVIGALGGMALGRKRKPLI